MTNHTSIAPRHLTEKGLAQAYYESLANDEGDSDYEPSEYAHEILKRADEGASFWNWPGLRDDAQARL